MLELEPSSENKKIKVILKFLIASYKDFSYGSIGNKIKTKSSANISLNLLANSILRTDTFLNIF